MPYNPNIHHRHSIRLREYDYSQAGLYFVTICIQNHECLFGEIVEGKMVLNNAGKTVQTIWNELPQHFQNAKLDAFVIMPNHIHGIIVITDDACVSACRGAINP
jgi:REP element-mobilizing transposase RayT